MDQEILTKILGVGFLGSALLTYLLIRENRRLNRENRIFSNLQAQVNNLYAPLNTLVLENENAIDLYNKYHREYDARYIQKNWSQDKETQELLHKEAKELLKVANQIIDKFVVENNEKIIALLREKSGYIDSDDNDIFGKFTEHHKRLKTEFDESGHLKIPLEIYDNIGKVSYMLPEFSQRVKEKYRRKKEELDSLMSNKNE